MLDPGLVSWFAIASIVSAASGRVNAIGWIQSRLAVRICTDSQKPEFRRRMAPKRRSQNGR
jgi:hypothetical protein